MYVPDLEEIYVQNFFKGISTEKPILVEFQPSKNSPENECFVLVEQHIKNTAEQKLLVGLFGNGQGL